MLVFTAMCVDAFTDMCSDVYFCVLSCVLSVC